MSGSALVVRGDALRLPLADESVDLIVTSPPFWALRSYRDGGEHYDGQLGSESEWPMFLDNLMVVMAECVRVLKPTGSIFVELGDKYAGSGGHNNAGISSKSTLQGNGHVGGVGKAGPQKIKATLRNAPDRYNQNNGGIRAKSLMLLPERFRIRCVDELGLIARATIIWSRLNGLPESVTDRVRRSHTDMVHLTKEGRYFAAVDEVREPHSPRSVGNHHVPKDGSVPQGDGPFEKAKGLRKAAGENQGFGLADGFVRDYNPLGKLPGSVWALASEPLIISPEVKAHYDLPDHFACVDDQTEILTKRGWLRHEALTVGDEVAGYNLDIGRAEWTNCHGVHRYAYDGDLVAVDKANLSMRLTPNHRCIVAGPDHWSTKRPGPLHVVRADELAPKHFVPRSAEWVPFEDKSIGEDMAALCGWVAAEGWVRYPDDVRLCQSLSANPEKVSAIDALLARLPLVMASRSDRKTFRPSILGLRRYVNEREWKGRPHTLVNWALPLGLAQEVNRLIPGKLLPWSFVGLPENERWALLNAFIDGDGHRRPDGRIGIFQKVKQNLDVLQAVAVTLGYKTNLTTEAERHVLYLTKGGRPLTLRGSGGAATPVGREHYKGTVWCPTTGTGTFFARRNGSVFITGNSFPTELVRRVVLGWSPSGVCTVCGEGRRPVVAKARAKQGGLHSGWTDGAPEGMHGDDFATRGTTEATITGYACRCGLPAPPTTPSRVLDVFGGTGTTAGVARALGRHGISVDLSHDYSRLADWRIHRSGHFAKVNQRTHKENQGTML